MLSFLAVLLVALLSTYKTLSFYFWHDDFSVLYTARAGVCTFKWPYLSYCRIFGFLDHFFNYSPNLYFLLAFILFVFMCFTFYFFLKGKISKREALVSSLIIASAYIGAGTFLEMYDSITLFLSLGLFILSLSLLKRSFVFSILIFLLSIPVHYGRSFPYIFIYVSAIVIFLNIKLVKKIIYCIVSLVVFVIFYFILPLGFTGFTKGGNTLTSSLSDLQFLLRLKLFFQNIGSIFATDELVRILKVDGMNLTFAIGIIVISFFILFTIYDRKDKKIFNLRIFSLVWIILQYLPYSLRSEWFLGSTSRYLLPAYVGVIIGWATFYKRRYWLFISILFLVGGIFQSNSFFENYLITGLQRKDFYHQLHQNLSKIDSNSYLFFNFSPDYKNIGNDFLRVGNDPPEAAIGAEYSVNYKNLKVFTENDVLLKTLKNISSFDSYYSFYFDGKKLIDTTNEARRVLINKYQTTKIIKNNNPLKFNIVGYSSILPATVNLELVAKPELNINFPYSKCKGKCESNLDNSYYLDALYNIKSLNNEVSLHAPDGGEDTLKESLMDYDFNTQWISNRQIWAKGNRSEISFVFPQKRSVGGLVFYSGLRRRPTIFKMKADGLDVNYSLKEFANGIEIVGNIFAKEIKVVINDTSDHDSPVINEIGLLPQNFANIDIDSLMSVYDNPAASIRNSNELNLLNKYLKLGAVSCLNWMANGYGEGISNFKLLVDGKKHMYNINVPAMGISDPVFELGCINYPVSLSVLSASASY